MAYPILIIMHGMHLLSMVVLMTMAGAEESSGSWVAATADIGNRALAHGCCRVNMCIKWRKMTKMTSPTSAENIALNVQGSCNLT